MTLKRTAIARTTPLARGGKVKARGDGQRRAGHPFPLPTPGERIAAANIVTELHAFGPQAALCRRTECAACFAVQAWRTGWPRTLALRWERLVTHDDTGHSEAHHEPHRSTRGDSLDRDTIPLCAAHHRTGNGDCVRHLLRSDATDSRRFYSLLPFDWRAVRDEMRRRTALEATP